jgi:ankyrin repeat protein
MAATYKDANDVLARVGGATVYLGIELKDVNDRGLFGSTPLSVVVTWGDLIAARLLIEAGADVNVITERGRTLLHDAVSFGNAEMVRLLLDSGVATDQKDATGARPIDIATAINRKDLVEILESYG